MIDIASIIQATPVPTRADALRQAGAENWPEPAQELLCRATAPERHQARVTRCYQVALAVAREIDPLEQRDGEIAALLCQAGWQGVGGPMDLGAESPGGNRTSQRIWPWRRCCGKGRANASDGPAWCQALYCAQTRISHDIVGDYYVPSGYVGAFEVILEWAGEDTERLAWAAQVQDHLRAHAGRRILNPWEPWRALWAEVYSAWVSPTGATAPTPVQEVRDLRIRLQEIEIEAAERANPSDCVAEPPPAYTAWAP